MLTYIVYYADLIEERDKLSEHFKKIDKDNNHIISKEELKQAFSDSGIILTDSAFKDIFAYLDTDKNGSIDYTEFLAVAIDWRLAINEKNLLEAFNFFDKDKSGEIDVNEVRKAIKTGWISEEQISKLFEKFDTNKDQKVILNKI